MDSLEEKFPHLPERLSGLGELAFNLWWSWHPEARMLFKRLDREAWKDTRHNPVKLLRVLPPEILEAAAADPEYLRHYDPVLAQFRRDLDTQVCWFTENITDAECEPIAYFSLEYGLHHSLPFYAGGLGFLAGDHLKECSDLGIPLVAVGFMYPGRLPAPDDQCRRLAGRGRRGPGPGRRAHHPGAQRSRASSWWCRCR